MNPNQLPLLEQLVGSNLIPQIFLSLFIILIVSFLVSRLTKRIKLPNVTAFLFAGLLIGPIFKLIYPPGLISNQIISSMSFLTDLALAFIAFSLGHFLKFTVFKKGGKKVFKITLLEILLTLTLMFGMMFLIGYLTKLFDYKLALLLAIIATSSSPTATMMIIRQTNASGKFVSKILQILALGNIIAIILFSLILQVIISPSITALTFILPILKILFSFIIGIIFAFIIHFIVNKSKRSIDNRLIIIITFILGISGISGLLHISPFLGSLAMGITYINLSKDDSLYDQLETFTPIFLTIFFVLTTMRLSFDSLVSVGLIAFAYFVARTSLKFIASKISTKVNRASLELRKYLAFILIPHAGIALGLVAFAANELSLVGLSLEATMLTTIIVASCLLFEMIGPPTVQMSLYLTNSYDLET